MEKIDSKICPSCNEKNNPALSRCWKCGFVFFQETAESVEKKKLGGQSSSLSASSILVVFAMYATTKFLPLKIGATLMGVVGLLSFFYIWKKTPPHLKLIRKILVILAANAIPLFLVLILPFRLVTVIAGLINLLGFLYLWRTEPKTPKAILISFAFVAVICLYYGMIDPHGTVDRIAIKNNLPVNV